VAQGVPGRLRSRLFLTFGTTRVVGRQPYAPAAFTPGESPGTHFLEAESTPGHIVLPVATEKISSDTTGNRSRNRPTSNAVPQTLCYPRARYLQYTYILRYTELQYCLLFCTGVKTGRSS
jgi:hypothetical protein